MAVRFPAGLVQALDLKEGEEIDLHLVDALLSGAPVLLSEDMHSGMLINGLVIQNPFKGKSS